MSSQPTVLRARQLPVIRTPDQRLRVFVSATLEELAEERAAARQAIEQLRLTPVHVFIGIYGERYGWIGSRRERLGNRG